MALPITPIQGVSAIQIPAAVTAAAAPSQPGAFAAVLKDSVGVVHQAQSVAHTSVERFLSGEAEELHHVALETQRAELTFELFVQVRNKVVQAYQDIMRMPV
jgi:flagellar hook-basal body complex protein FliE